jgi:hypothetical protein
MNSKQTTDSADITARDIHEIYQKVFDEHGKTMATLSDLSKSIQDATSKMETARISLNRAEEFYTSAWKVTLTKPIPMFFIFLLIAGTLSLVAYLAHKGYTFSSGDTKVGKQSTSLFDKNEVLSKATLLAGHKRNLTSDDSTEN